MEKLCKDMGRPVADDPDYKIILSAQYGQMLCLLLESLAEGNLRGEHRMHLSGYRTLIQHSPARGPGLPSLHLRVLPVPPLRRRAAALPRPAHPAPAHRGLALRHRLHAAGACLGVVDGLFNYMCRITAMRNQIRTNMAAQIDPRRRLHEPVPRRRDRRRAVRDWKPIWPPGDSRDRVTLLYKQMMWVYLCRTIQPPTVAAGSSSSSSSSSPRCPRRGCRPETSPRSCCRFCRCAAAVVLVLPGRHPGRPVSFRTGRGARKHAAPVGLGELRVVPLAQACCRGRRRPR